MRSLHRRNVTGLLAVVGLWGVLLSASPQQPRPNVVVEAPKTAVPTSSRSAAPPSLNQQTGNGSVATCVGSAPGPEWTCVNGNWQTGAAASAGSGTTPPAGNGGGNCV